MLGTVLYAMLETAALCDSVKVTLEIRHYKSCSIHTIQAPERQFECPASVVSKVRHVPCKQINHHRDIG
jgi:hypothetical protein